MTTRTAANRYARALLDVARHEGDPQAADGQLAAIVEVLTGHAVLWKVLTNPAIGTPDKRAIVEALLPRVEAAPAVRKLVLLLTERDRMGLLPEIADAYRARLLDFQGVVRADVTTAVPLPADRAARLEQGLAALTGRRVVMTAATDAALMGGVVTRIGSTVYDGSVKRQLEKMKERLEQAI